MPHFQVSAKCKPKEANEQGKCDQKWQVCQDFKEVNKHSKVALMPQGDIWVKQHHLSGHQYVSIIDFASGFYAVKIHKESCPYTAFYIEGLGHFWYVHMPFGLTGAPTAFAVVTANHLHDLIANEVMEIFINDGGIATDSFNEMEAKLWCVLDRVRECTLSLLAAKSHLFMEEELFAGTWVGTCRVLPDLTKLTAVVDWKRPAMALNLMSFLGLTRHFRDLIKGYAKVKGPLRDLVTKVKLPQPCTKSIYRHILRNHKLDST
jgi:hypothetical protein